MAVLFLIVSLVEVCNIDIDYRIIEELLDFMFCTFDCIKQDQPV